MVDGGCVVIRSKLQGVIIFVSVRQQESNIQHMHRLFQLYKDILIKQTICSDSV